MSQDMLNGVIYRALHRPEILLLQQISRICFPGDAMLALVAPMSR